MQRTRLNSLFDLFLLRLEQFFLNPWRRISLLIIAFLSGTFIAQAVSTTGGQLAFLDVTMAALVLLFTELVSIFAYRRLPSPTDNNTQRRPLLLTFLNIFKIGLVYGLYIEAFKLGS